MMFIVRRFVITVIAAVLIVAACLAGCKSGGQGAEDQKVSGEEAASKAKAMLMKGPGAAGDSGDAAASKAKEMLMKGPGAGQ